MWVNETEMTSPEVAGLVKSREEQLRNLFRRNWRSQSGEHVQKRRGVLKEAGAVSGSRARGGRGLRGRGRREHALAGASWLQGTRGSSSPRGQLTSRLPLPRERRTLFFFLIP